MSGNTEATPGTSISTEQLGVKEYNDLPQEEKKRLWDKWTEEEAEEERNHTGPTVLNNFRWRLAESFYYGRTSEPENTYPPEIRDGEIYFVKENDDLVNIPAKVGDLLKLTAEGLVNVTSKEEEEKAQSSQTSENKEVESAKEQARE
jgi:hypothetical protein